MNVIYLLFYRDCIGKDIFWTILNRHYINMPEDKFREWLVWFVDLQESYLGDPVDFANTYIDEKKKLHGAEHA
jgi:hypothetical protein